MFIVVVSYGTEQLVDYLIVGNPDIISMEKRIDRRFTDEITFRENQFNLAFEFV